MKNLTLIIIISGIISLFFSLSSCEDFLDKAPGVNDVSEDSIFSSVRNVNSFLFSIYQMGIHSNLPYGKTGDNNNYKEGYANSDETLSAGATDEAETIAAWYNETQSWNDGSVNANQFGDKRVDRRFQYRWDVIRMISIMIDRVDGVPDPAMTDAYKRQVKAEVKVIRALNYLEMLKRYGGVPIIDHRIALTDDLNIPRSSFEEVVNFILRDCNDAFPDLPIHQLGSDRGRIHRGVALSIIAKTLLYAASPLYNTETPYMSFPDPANNKLLCYGNYSQERWEKAAEASAKVIFEWAPAAGCELVTGDIDMNYRNAWEKYDNMEIILAEKSRNNLGKYTWPWSAFCPIAKGNAGESGITPLMNFVRKYEKRDGTPQEWNLTIDPSTGRGTPSEGLQEKFAQLDRRFSQSILYNMGYWNVNEQVVPLYQEAIKTYETTNAHTGVISKCKGGFWLHKLYPYSITGDNWNVIPNSTIFQLNEFYLSFAEAMFEAYGPEDRHGYPMSAREAVNVIRTRSGQPEIQAGELTQERIRNERAIEMAFDNHRFWDIRRWMIAEQEGVMKGDMIGIEIHLIDGAEPKLESGFYYIPVLVERRTFTRKMYMHPFPTAEVNKGYLIQNPGY